MCNVICWHCMTKCKMMRRFSSSQKFIANLALYLGRWKSNYHHFLNTQSPVGGILPFYQPKKQTDCAIWDLNSQYFIFFIHTHVSSKHMPKWDVCLRQHSLGWQIWNIGSSAPILLWQSCLGTPRGMVGTYIVFTCMINIKKIMIFFL